MTSFSGYLKGINLGGWLSQCIHTKEHYDNFIKEDDIKTISTWNIDHIRVPIDYELVEDANGNYIEEGFTYISNVILWCKKFGLNMILDLHKTFGYSFDVGENEDGFFENVDYQERFYKLWEELAGRFAENDDMLAFELLNEVTDQKYCEIWNSIALRCISRIRKISDSIIILVGGYGNNSVTAVKDLPLFTDENIIYNFHCYDPLAFTHQGAPWVKDMPHDFRMKFNDSGADVNYFEELFSEAIKASEDRNIPLYCGEYGVIDRADPKEAVEWYKAIHKVFNNHSIGHATWSYKKMDFGLTDERAKEILDEIIKH